MVYNIQDMNETVNNRIVLHFTRQFTRGNLKGILHADKISFIDLEHANRWIQGVSFNSDRGVLNYKLVKLSFEVPAWQRCRLEEM
jgi:hypothetical protein